MKMSLDMFLWWSMTMALEFQMMIELGINHNKLCGWQTIFVSVTRKQMFTISILNQQI
jgi:hypothetical protein